MSHDLSREAPEAQQHSCTGMKDLCLFFCLFFALASFSLACRRLLTLSDLLQHAVHGFNLSRVLGVLSLRAVGSRAASPHLVVDGLHSAILSARDRIDVLVSDLGLAGHVGDSAGDRRSSCRSPWLDLPRRAGLLLHGNHSHRSLGHPGVIEVVYIQLT